MLIRKFKKKKPRLNRGGIHPYTPNPLKYDTASSVRASVCPRSLMLQ